MRQRESFTQELPQRSDSSYVQKELDAHAAISYDKPEREPVIQAQQIMATGVVTVMTGTPLSQTLEIFQQRRYRHGPVLSDQLQLIGIISDRDLWRVIAKAMSKSERGMPSAGSLPVQEVMSTPVLSAHPQTEIRAIARAMFEERIGAMPIVNDDQSLVGIITRSDILRGVTIQVPFELWI